MNTNRTKPQDEQSRRDLWRKIRIQRLFTSIPVCWEEVEELLSFASRQDAQRFVNGEVDDFNRRVFYDELFRWHPALRAALTQETSASPETVIVLRPEREMADAAEHGLRAAASPSCAADDESGDVLLSNEDGWELWASPHPRLGCTTLRFVGRQPPRSIVLRAADREVPQIEPLDEHGYLVVATADVTAVLNGQAELTIHTDRDGQRLLVATDDVRLMPELQQKAHRELEHLRTARLIPDEWDKVRKTLDDLKVTLAHPREEEIRASVRRLKEIRRAQGRRLLTAAAVGEPQVADSKTLALLKEILRLLGIETDAVDTD